MNEWQRERERVEPIISDKFTKGDEDRMAHSNIGKKKEDTEREKERERKCDRERESVCVYETYCTLEIW